MVPSHEGAVRTLHGDRDEPSDFKLGMNGAFAGEIVDCGRERNAKERTNAYAIPEVHRLAVVIRETSHVRTRCAGRRLTSGISGERSESAACRG